MFQTPYDTSMHDVTIIGYDISDGQKYWLPEKLMSLIRIRDTYKGKL